jgi:hypothetical protein
VADETPPRLAERVTRHIELWGQAPVMEPCQVVCDRIQSRVVGGVVMDEQDFWLRLEYRISAEFQGFEDKHLRWYGCDGLVAEEYDVLAAEPCIRGRAWCGPDGQEPWRFVLFVGSGMRSRDEIDWSALLPGERTTGWLSPDPRNKTVVIDPLSSFPE